MVRVKKAPAESLATAVVLAGGRGKRLKSDLPKVLHRVGGRPLLVHVLSALQPLPLERKVIVVPKKSELIEAALSANGFGDVSYVIQDPPRGTGDAVKIALESLGDVKTVLVVSGDSPLVRTETLGRVLDAHVATKASATVLTARVADPTGYGRIVRGSGKLLQRIVEELDATPEEQRLDEIGVGVYAFEAARLARVLAKVETANVQGEYYLTDVIALLADAGDDVRTVETSPDEVGGVNTRMQLTEVSEALRRRVCAHWIANGVTIVDPQTTYIDTSVVIDRDATILPFTFLEGETTVGEGAEVGPQVRIIDSAIGPGASVSFSVVRGSQIGPDASVGPFASLRPGTTLERDARVGTFVETKQTKIGPGSKANHLSYLGDAEIGRGVNVGAGTITCNWDGREKHATVIEDHAYIGSDTMLVAPTRIGKRAATGAGSVVRGDVPADALAVGMPARIIEGKGDKMGEGTRRSEAAGTEPDDESDPSTPSNGDA